MIIQYCLFTRECSCPGIPAVKPAQKGIKGTRSHVQHAVSAFSKPPYLKEGGNIVERIYFFI